MANHKLPYVSEPIKNIVLVGGRGNGKSATGNSILGERKFVSKKQAAGTTLRCEMYEAAMQDGQVINVIDTPGFSDLSSADYVSEEIINCLTRAEEGIHVVLLVLSLKSRISRKNEPINALQQIFGSKIHDFLIVVFTGGDELEADGLTLDEWLGVGIPEFLTRTLRLCNNRRVLFNNRTCDEEKKAEQLKQLMGHVADIGRQNGGIPYTDKLLHKLKEPIKNIVLVGRTGTGKSATGNTLLGGKMFISKRKAVGVTMKCEMYRAAIQDGPIINVIDTPGLFDSAVSNDYISTEIVNCLTMAKEGIHAVLFVLSAGSRISQAEESTLDTLERIFESKIFNHFIVVFTGGDELEKDGQTLDDYLRQGYPEFLTRVLKLCDGRMVLFNNRTNDKEKKAEQLKQLFAHVADVEKQNGGKPYSDQMYHTIKKEGDRFKEQKKKAESQKRAVEAAVIKQNLEVEYDEKMRRIAQLLERRLQQSSEVHERKMRALREAHETEMRELRAQDQHVPPPDCTIL